MNKNLTGLVISMLLIATTVSVAGTSNNYEKEIDLRQGSDWWPMYGHDEANTGYSPSFAPETDNLILKKTLNPQSDEDESLSTAIMVNGSLYIGYPSGLFFCANAYDGEVLWSKQPGVLGNITGTPAVDGNLLYICAGNTLICLNAESGQIQWTFTTGGLVKGSPTIAKNKIYFGSYDKKLYCIDNEGNEVWNFTTVKEIFTAPAVVNDYVYVAASDPINFGESYLYCLYATNGTEKWSYYRGASPATSPVVSDERVFVGIFNTMLSLDTAGKVKWIYTLTGVKITAPSLAYNNIYFGTYANQNAAAMYCLNASNKQLTWTYDFNDDISCPPSIADEKVYFGGTDKYFYCVDAIGNGDGTTDLLWNWKSSGMQHPAFVVRAQPSIADGIVYIVGDKTARVYGFADNDAPDIPQKPSGPTEGEAGVSYCYTTVTTDPDGDQVRYGWDWDGDDKVDEWTEYYESGVEVEVCHIWQKAGKYDVKVLAEDQYGEQSLWSSSTQVTITSVLEIGDINGGIWVSTEIKNIGSHELSNVNWTISIKGGFLGKINIMRTKNEPKLEPDQSIKVRVFPIIGLGDIKIEIKVHAVNVAEITKTGTGTVFIFLIFIS